MGNVGRQRTDPTSFECFAEKLELVSATAVSDCSAPVRDPMPRIGPRERIEHELCAQAGHNSIVVPISRRIEIPLDECAEKPIVALQLQRQFYTLLPEPAHKVATQRIKI